MSGAEDALTLRAQAEPHIARHPTNADLLAATFQEGRYTNGGALDCGYAISHDGGLTWTRALIPGVTPAVGGPYYRASDPVAGIDRNGFIYLNTLATLDSSMATSALLLSRSTNSGATFEAWRKVAEVQDPSILRLSLSDVLLDEAHELTPERYPDQLTVDGATLAHSVSGSGAFSDLRVIDGSGRQIPYLMERVSEPLSLDLDCFNLFRR